jgi:hypothetical protein
MVRAMRTLGVETQMTVLCACMAGIAILNMVVLTPDARGSINEGGPVNQPTGFLNRYVVRR